jgi:3D (Asp-Asp-Asp) domain-containing protein
VVGSGHVVDVTMYCYTGSRNAAGNWPTVGTAAGNAWPLGTHLHVEGVGVVVIEDRSAPGATGVDLYGGSDAGCEARAAAWGRRYLNVRVAS